MKIIVLSDIHGNAFALDAALADFRGDSADQIVCLGDAIQGGPQPAEVVARLRDLACPVIMGNADDWLLRGEETGSEVFSDERLVKMETVRDWSLAQLSEADLAFIEAFRPTVEIPLSDGQSLLCFHGSPASFNDIILPSTPEAEFEAFLTPKLARFMTGGHTHIQNVRRIGTGDHYYFNPGSIGVAYSHNQADENNFRTDAWAEYAVLSIDHGRYGLEFRHVPYDAQALIEIYRASGRPHAEDMIAQYQPA